MLWMPVYANASEGVSLIIETLNPQNAEVWHVDPYDVTQVWVIPTSLELFFNIIFT